MSLDNLYSSRLDRLITLQGTDPGFFTLAVHSFIEATLRERYDRCSLEVSFNEIVEMFRNECCELSSTNSLYKKYLPTIQDWKKSHNETNGVRHQFSFLNEEKARSATFQLGIFCTLSEIHEISKLNELNRYLSLWDEKRPLGALKDDYKRLYNESVIVAKKQETLLLQIETLRSLKEEADFLDAKVKMQILEISKLEKETIVKINRIADLRRKNYEEREHLKEARKQIDELKEVESYVDTLRSMTLYTRTRGDYERLIIRLTAEQQEVLKRISLNKDFLIKGKAGTGKTLVLLKAIEKAREKEDMSSIVLLTYTNALVKYDTYIASILDPNNENRVIGTADAFFLERLQEICPNITPSSSILKEIVTSHNLGEFSVETIVAEIEKFIWSNDVSEDEYVKEMINRKGMKSPLKMNERKEIWKIKTLVEEELSRRDTPFRYIPILLLRAIEEGRDESFTLYDYIFVDEAQDLSASALKVLKLFARKALILAGDANQSIYQAGFSYSRAGIDIAGRTKVLKMNYRNTVQIHTLAERFRRTYTKENEDTTFHSAFRDGPPVEHFASNTTTSLCASLAMRVGFFIKDLEYDPENICIITPSKKDFEEVVKALKEIRVECGNILDKKFQFDSSGSVRLTTMHSAKGLDFPVILLYLPHIPRVREEYDDELNESLCRNLMYVSITRAMEHVNIFTLKHSEDSVIRNLVEVLSDNTVDG